MFLHLVIGALPAMINCTGWKERQGIFVSVCKSYRIPIEMSNGMGKREHKEPHRAL